MEYRLRERAIIGQMTTYIGDNGKDLYIAQMGGEPAVRIPLTLGKQYKITALYGSNIVVTDDEGKPVNGHGLHYSRFTIRSISQEGMMGLPNGYILVSLEAGETLPLQYAYQLGGSDRWLIHISPPNWTHGGLSQPAYKYAYLKPKEIHKITRGFVRQRWDENGIFLGQEFVPTTDPPIYEDKEGNRLDECCYEPLLMIQPQTLNDNPLSQESNRE